MPPLRIAYLVSRYPAISHTFILREVQGLEELGFDIRVASINAPDRPAAQLTAAERAEAEKCFYVKRAARRLPWDLAAILLARPWALLRTLGFALTANGWDAARAAMNLLYLAEAVILARWMRGRGLAHLHVHFATPAATVALLAAKLIPAHLSITVHGPDEFYDTGAYLLPEKCSGAQFLCAISDFASSQLKKMMAAREWAKIRVVPLGVDLDAFQPVRQGEAAGGADFRLICVGRLVPAKGQHVLLEALGLLRQAGRGVRLTLVGDGPDRAALEEAVRRGGMAPAVTFTGAINQDHIRALYGTADVFVLASFAEGVPVVLMEAMAMELPCVSTWVAGIPELIRDGRDGLLVPPSNARALADAVARLMDDAELRRRLGQAGRARIREKYDLRRNVARLGEVFAEAMDVGLGQAA